MTRGDFRLRLILVFVGLLIAGRSPALASEEPEVLTSTRAVRLLAPDLAAQERPVHLTAIVNYTDPDGTVFIQDDSAGTFFRRKDRATPWKRGERVDVAGTTFPGLYIPGINATTVQTLGQGGLPPAVRCTAEDLASGKYHYMRVAVDGIGRSSSVSGENAAVLRIAVGTRQVEVRINDVLPAGLALDDARLHVEGLAAGVINGRRELVSPYLKVASFRDVTVLDPPPRDPFALPPIAIANLLRFNPSGDAGRRIKTLGTVTAVRPPDMVFLREGEQALLAYSQQAETLQPGDVVEILGFPQMGTTRAELADAAVRRVSRSKPPLPRAANVRGLLSGHRDTDLVSLEGDLIAEYATPDGDVLALQAESTVFRVRSLKGKGAQASGWPSGSRLAVTGICRIVTSTEKGFSLKPVSFEVWARTPSDVRLLASPSWWTVQRLSLALGVLVVATTAAIVWATLLKRRVREQTRIIRDQLAREMIREERERIAREVHDTLEQELVGLSLRIDAATALADARQVPILETMRRLVGRAQTEVHELVWDLRDLSDDSHKLVQTLKRTAEELGQTSAVQFALAVTGTPWPLPILVEHNVARIAQEAVTNALKHAEPTTVSIDVAFEPEHLCVRIRDDGLGFDPLGKDAARPGHFGLVGMRERSRKVGLNLRVASRLGEGTLVELSCPRSST